MSELQSLETIPEHKRIKNKKTPRHKRSMQKTDYDYMIMNSYNALSMIHKDKVKQDENIGKTMINNQDNHHHDPDIIQGKSGEIRNKVKKNIKEIYSIFDGLCNMLYIPENKTSDNHDKDNLYRNKMINHIPDEIKDSFQKFISDTINYIDKREYIKRCEINQKNLVKREVDRVIINDPNKGKKNRIDHLLSIQKKKKLNNEISTDKQLLKMNQREKLKKKNEHF